MGRARPVHRMRDSHRPALPRQSGGLAGKGKEGGWRILVNSFTIVGLQQARSELERVRRF